MEGWRADTYGERIAADYDARLPGRLDTAACVELLAALAGGGPVLELGVGTGRVALPLAARGLQVDGIDASAAMVARLKAKPGGAGVRVVVGDFAAVPAPGAAYRLVYVVFNTLFCLLAQDDQARCFAAVADRLAGDGVFVVEAFVPDPARLAKRQDVTVERIEPDRVELSAVRYDPLAQRIDAQHVTLTPGGVHLAPVALRYAWPAELDLLARLAGLRLRDRWGGWRREPLDADSGQHVSVYERAAP